MTPIHLLLIVVAIVCFAVGAVLSPGVRDRLVLIGAVAAVLALLVR